MAQQTDNPVVQNRLRSNISESERNIEYLTERLKELEFKARSQQSGSGGAQQASQRNSIGAPPPPPPKDSRHGSIENGRGYDPHGRGGWPQPGPGMPVKSRQYTRLGIFRYLGIES